MTDTNLFANNTSFNIDNHSSSGHISNKSSRSSGRLGNRGGGGRRNRNPTNLRSIRKQAKNEKRSLYDLQSDPSSNYTIDDTTKDGYRTFIYNLDELIDQRKETQKLVRYRNKLFKETSSMENTSVKSIKREFFKVQREFNGIERPKDSIKNTELVKDWLNSNKTER
ncbi:uncharacterized protein L201_005208 [Kwoniella dendrophila CBS 6074]|uniref:Uncharacterized protein n=1 Tax=Kwoniella dendrophila CBS 6074 TaxID=1295534 RepID=A0AAX4K0G6_9TREE